jgi:uncharacterized membrane protein
LNKAYNAAENTAFPTSLLENPMSYEKLVNHRIESRFSFYAAAAVALIALGVLAGWHLHAAGFGSSDSRHDSDAV